MSNIVIKLKFCTKESFLNFFRDKIRVNFLKAHLTLFTIYPPPWIATFFKPS